MILTVAKHPKNMNDLVEAELKHLESIFKGKRLLSPADIAPLIGLSIGTMANQRSKGVFLLPIKKIGRKIGCHISVVAHYLVLGEPPAELSDKAAPTTTSRVLKAPAPRKNRSGLTATKDWINAMENPIEALQQTLAFNVELLQLVKRETLAKETGIDLTAKRVLKVDF
jgi:hypothetical protein